MGKWCLSGRLYTSPAAHSSGSLRPNPPQGVGVVRFRPSRDPILTPLPLFVEEGWGNTKPCFPPDIIIRLGWLCDLDKYVVQSYGSHPHVLFVGLTPCDRPKKITHYRTSRPSAVIK